tara:strand:+ start:1048 stop:1617 length:570 start_codon:yes stop_codon:yes gene_type:complete
VSEILTRQEITDREQAQRNLPTPERIAKGDIITYGREEWAPDIVNPRATIPTAKARLSRPRITQLHDRGVINDDLYWACCLLRSWWNANRNEVIAKVKIAAWQNSGLPRQQWQPVVEEVLHRQWCYNYLRNPDNGMKTEELNVLEKVVCFEETISKALRGDKWTRTQRFTEMLIKLRKVIDTIPRNEVD